MSGPESEQRFKFKRKCKEALLSCEESFQLSDRFGYETESDPLETDYIEFKDTAAWKQAYNELKEILSAREHWPNKPERKTVRTKNINENPSEMTTDRRIKRIFLLKNDNGSED